MSSSANVIPDHNFSTGFQKLCNFAAIAETSGALDTLSEIIKLCLAIFPEVEFRNEIDFEKTAKELFGLSLPDHQLKYAIDTLMRNGEISRPFNNAYKLAEDSKATILRNINKVTKNEYTVKEIWYESLKNDYPTVDPDVLWISLKEYLQYSFQRHGLQAVALLDPSFEVPVEQTRNLTVILNQAIDRHFTEDKRERAKQAIISFLAEVGKFPERARFISSLADAAFNYFTLVVDPEVSSNLRANLERLTLFLDTNFLIGILNLHSSSQVKVSHELVNAINKHSLPFIFRYHEETGHELINSINHYKGNLLVRSWPRVVSRSAAQSFQISGIELKYHQKNAEFGIDVPTFFKPYLHTDIILKEKNIDIFRPITSRLIEITDLIEEYKEFLKLRGREKGDPAIIHDMLLLDAVRSLRTKNKTTIQAGSLLLTCDYLLYRFDWESSRRHGILPCTVVPNIFWQIIKPYFPVDADFQSSFAETFAIPEFRTLGSGGGVACTRMLGILASYQPFPEAAATKMLSNDIFIEKVKNVGDEAKFREMIDSELARENATLIEDKAALAFQLEAEKAARLADERKTEEALQQLRLQIEQQRNEVSIKASELERTAQTANALHSKAVEDQCRLTTERAQKEALLKELDKERSVRISTEKTNQLIYAGLSAVLLSGIFIYGVHRYQWKWLINNNNSYGIQMMVIATILFMALGVFRKDMRKKLFGIGFVAMLIVALAALLGGPSSVTSSAPDAPLTKAK